MKVSVGAAFGRYGARKFLSARRRKNIMKRKKDGLETSKTKKTPHSSAQNGSRNTEEQAGALERKALKRKQPFISVEQREEKLRKLNNPAHKTIGQQHRKPPLKSQNDTRYIDRGKPSVHSPNHIQTSRMDESPARRKLDGDTLQYFAEISSLLGVGGSVTDPEERAALCENALEETHGKELELACDKSCSRVLEMLIFSCDATQIASFLHRAASSFVSMANDASGSHVAESLLKAAARTLHGKDEQAAWYKTLKQALMIICQVLGEKAADVMINCHGSHVVRSLLSLLSGAPFESLSDKSRRRRLGGHGGRLSCTSDVDTKISKQNLLFPGLFNSLVEKLLGAAGKNLSVLIVEPFAGPVLQAILKILAGDNSAITKALRTLLECDTQNMSKQEVTLGSIPSGYLKDLICDNSGSHLVEVMLEVAPDAIYNEIFEHIATYNIREFALHGSANFVVQALVASARHQDQVSLLYKKLSPHFPEIIKQMRSGVITSIVAACKRFSIHQQEACKALARALNTDLTTSPALVLRLLFLECYARAKSVEHWKPGFGKRMSVLGCTILQLVFSFSEDLNQQYWLSLAAMDPVDVLAMVNDPGGCHVVESFLLSSVPLKHKHKVISKLKGHFVELSSHMLSAFTVEKCFSVGNMDLKEAIAAELSLAETDLAKTKHGPHLLKKCEIARYSRSPQQWRVRLNAKHGTMKAFSEMFHTKGATKLSAR